MGHLLDLDLKPDDNRDDDRRAVTGQAVTVED